MLTLIRDAQGLLSSYLLNDRRSMTQDEYEAMQKEVKDQVRASVEFAESSPAPEVEAELYSDVYANLMANLSPTKAYNHGAKNPLL